MSILQARRFEIQEYTCEIFCQLIVVWGEEKAIKWKVHKSEKKSFSIDFYYLQIDLERSQATEMKVACAQSVSSFHDDKASEFVQFPHD